MTTFPDLTGYSSSSPSVSVSGTTSTVTVNSAFNGAGLGGSPFNSVYGVPVTVSSSSNLAYPFTANVTNGHTFQDADTGIDVLAGGQVTFRMPSAGTGMWCFELGRSLAGQSFCSGPAGYHFDYWSYPCAPARQADSPCGTNQDKCNNSMINGAWNSADQPTMGSALSFTYARSGALMARVGAKGQSNQQANEQPNAPVNEYFSAFDNAAACPTAILTSAFTVSGASNTYTMVSSGRLYLAIFRWNFFPNLANGSVNVLIDYTSPLQVALSSSQLNGSTAGSSQHPVVVTATQSSSSQGVFPTTATLTTAAPGTVTATGYLPVLNITGLTLNPATSNAGSPVNSSTYTYYGTTNQVSFGQAAGENQSTSLPWLSAYLPPAVALSNTFSTTSSTVGVDMQQLLTVCSSAAQQQCSNGFIFPASQSNMLLDPYLQQYYPPCNNDYDCDYDTGINVIEGGSITLTSPASDQWCYPNYWSSQTASCSNAAGNASIVWNGCSGSFTQLQSNGAYYGVWPNATSDNSGCNSDSDMQAPIGAVAFRIGIDSTGMRHGGFLDVSYHSSDYYYAFPNAASGGMLTNTFTAAVSGRLYLAFQGPGLSPSSFSSPPYSGGVHVSASYTPPPNLMFGLTWSPNPNNVQQPYLFTPPSTPTDTGSLASGRYLAIPDTISSPVSVTFWVYQQVFTGAVTTGSGSGTVAVSSSSSTGGSTTGSTAGSTGGSANAATAAVVSVHCHVVALVAIVALLLA